MFRNSLILFVYILLISCKSEKKYFLEGYSFDEDNRIYVGRLIDKDSKIIEYDALAISNSDLIYKKLYIFLKLNKEIQYFKHCKIFLYLFLNYTDKSYNNIKIIVSGLNRSYDKIYGESINSIIVDSKITEHYFKINKTKINKYSIPIDNESGFLEFDITDLAEYINNGLLIYLDDYSGSNYSNTDKYNQLTYVEQVEFFGSKWGSEKRLKKYIPYVVCKFN